MKRYILAVIIGAAVTVIISCSGTEQAQKQQTKPIINTDSLLSYQDNISTRYMRRHLSAFSADSMKGRDTGTPAEDKAARYLAHQYRKLGLQPVGDNNSYFQHFDLNATKTDSIVYKLFATSDEQKLVDYSTASKNSSAHFIRQFGGTDSLQGKIVFAGFGVDDSKNDIQNLQGVTLKDKWVMVFGNIPHIVEGDTLIDPTIDARARFQSIMDRGAEGILLIPEKSSDFSKVARQQQSNFGKLSDLKLAYRDDGSGSSGGFSKGYNIIKPALAAQLLDIESKSALEDYRQQLIDNIASFQPDQLNYKLSHVPYTAKEKVTSKNVLAFYEGADPKLKDEVVVMTSHYDHLGIGQPDSTGDRIYNGADDDGSGTIGILNVARAFANAGDNGVKPKRSILFLHVSGEEKGLLGSRYYSDHPVFPMEKTVADINTDMIGRIDKKHKKQGTEEYSYIIGGDIISSQLDSLINAGNKKSGQITLSDRYNDLQDPNQFYRRSDHWHFGRKGVPFVFFFSGVHEDYHRPSDEVHKIRFDKMSKIVRTMYGSAVMIANTENPPAVDNQAFIEKTKGDN
ncbi:Peptidase family M28 [Fodinibius salinus]|uniref:Peptidase family M28 n=1 Tax=Fodinibius salinus TaxID=860790 RepID=A0A5D3YNH8_9BACT|nr:M28 family peptidase [Fodinibius salinus]TYP93699.1 Peptidase family M28 [Fodinibius salinus]